MRNFFLTTGLMLITLSASAQQWKELINLPETKTMIDLESISKESGYLYGNVRQIDFKPNPVQSDVRFVFSCETQTGALIEGISFMKDQAGDRVLKDSLQRGALPKEYFSPFKANSYGEALMSFACTWQSLKEQIIQRLPLKR